MTGKRKPGFMKLSLGKETAPVKGSGFTKEERAAAEAMAVRGGILGTAEGEEEGLSEGPGAGARAGAAGLLQRIEETAAFVRSALTPPETRIGIILGSGLGAFAEDLDDARFVDYSMIPHFPRSTVAGHRGRLGFGRAGGVPLFAMQGRFHFYEGYSLEDVTFPVRVLGRLGARLLVVTNASGGIGEHLGAGDLMVMDDHLNFMGANPLRGPHDDRLGARFPDMSEIYARRFREAVRAAAPEGTPLKSGVYAAMAGPSYETPAEIRMLARLGADAVGMSTVPEAIVASQMGLGVLGISCVANMAAGLVSGHRLTHQEVVDTMNATAGTFAALLRAALPALEKAI